MASPRSAWWAAAGAIGSVALAAGLSPAAFADTGDNGAQVPPARTANVVLSLENEKLALDLDLEHGTGAIDASQGVPAADLEVGPDTRTTVPAGDDYAFLGKPGSPVWVLDGRTSGTPAPRWDTTAVPTGQLAESNVEWALTGIEGPGDIAVFEPTEAAAPGDEAPGPEVLFDSTDGLPDAHALPAADSGEVVWAFTEPGEYRLTSRAAARLVTGEDVTTTTEWTVRVAEDIQQPPALPALPAPASSPAGDDGQGTGDGEASARTGPARAPAPAVKAATDSGVLSQKVVIDDGHVDAIAGKMVGGKLRTLFKDSRNPADISWREPSSVVLHVRPAAKEKVPANSAYSFLGKAGSDFWLIPQVQKQGVVWAGWNTESLDGGDLKGPLDMKLTKVTGPGSLAIWETAGLGGAQVLYNSGDGLPDTQKVNLGVHAHGNWGFSKQGTYKVTFQLSGRLPSGKTSSDTRTYTFAVGDVDPDAVTPGGGSDDGGSTGGTGTTGGAGSAGDSTSGSTGGPGTTGGTGGGTASGGSPTTGGGNAGGSLAHTGGGAAVPLALGAGVLVLGGTAAVVVSRANRRRAVTATAGGEAVQS
ncbi:TIGR03773 family transporter-associated surface protein [Streptomyces scopuliridis]|uniref:TIGR03773 family transporter-associated surface protein n=1 Tax=Streptomyces scopuliridis TaxID=452529 RepID=A0ACD4ZE98_9ACTN|nr:TIGR03773 family transporter-associated surface protein [Streptomyces scopuliridis]WSB96789.1 TIGR03773 family transporter-associated surface protein [Streptomyces scopuliridis]WSC09507.1 TIGR03773 family transporter-associated surface protein [Streptomyces scopuliridis]